MKNENKLNYADAYVVIRKSLVSPLGRLLDPKQLSDSCLHKGGILYTNRNNEIKSCTAIWIILCI